MLVSLHCLPSALGALHFLGHFVVDLGLILWFLVDDWFASCLLKKIQFGVVDSLSRFRSRRSSKFGFDLLHSKC